MEAMIRCPERLSSSRPLGRRWRRRRRRAGRGGERLRAVGPGRLDPWGLEHGDPVALGGAPSARRRPRARWPLVPLRWREPCSAGARGGDQGERAARPAARRAAAGRDGERSPNPRLPAARSPAASANRGVEQARAGALGPAATGSRPASPRVRRRRGDVLTARPRRLGQDRPIVIRLRQLVLVWLGQLVCGRPRRPRSSVPNPRPSRVVTHAARGPPRLGHDRRCREAPRTACGPRRSLGSLWRGQRS